MNKDHLILRPAEYAHQNIDRYSIVDSSNVRGGRRSVYSVTDMYNIPEDKLSENVSIVYVESEDTEYRLTDISNKGNYKGWVELKYGSDSPAKIATKGAIKQSTSGDTVTLNLSLALESGLNPDPLSIKIADSSKEYLYLNSNGLNFNPATITSAVSGSIKDFQSQIDSKQDTLNSSNTVSIDTYDNNKLKIILNKGEGYLIETDNGLDTNIQPTLDKKADLINGIVPASQLPSYIDDIRNLTYMKAGSPDDITGTVLGELYYNTSSNALFEWKSVVPEGETSAVTQWIQVEPSTTTIYLYTGSEPYTQWRWVSDPGVLQKINQDLAWSNGVCTSHIVDGSTQYINVNILKDDPLLKVQDNTLQSNPAKDWDIWGENLTFNEVTGKIDGLNTSYTAGDGIAIDDSAIRRKDVVANASAVSNVYTVNFAYPLQTVSNVKSNLTLSLPTSNGRFVGPISGETKTVIVQILNKASSSITVTLPTSISGVTVYNMYSKPNVILMANQLGELWITATESTVTIKAFLSYVETSEKSTITFPESTDYTFIYDAAEKDSLNIGDQFTFKVQMADEFKAFKSITLTDETGNPVQFTLNGTYVTIPQMPKEVNIVVDYTKRFTLTLTATEGGSVTGNGVYDENETATIQAIPDNGYYFKKWSDEDINSNRSITITKDISLQAIFDTLKQITFSQMNNCQVQTEPGAQIPGDTVTFTLVPMDSSFNYQGVYILDAGSNEISYTKVVNEDKTVTISFVMPETNVDVQASYVASYNISVVKSQNGTTNVQSTATAGEEVAVSFVPNTGYTEFPTITIINVTTGEELPYSVSKAGDVTFVMPESNVNITTIFNPISIGEAVDLGLPSGLLWSNMNIGATTPEGYGNYYAWGETKPKETYNWSTYQHGNSSSTLTKYNSTDGKTTLEPEDDAATVNWGGTWRMPTTDEFTELHENCIWTWTTLNNINGYEVKSKTNNNSIFLPAAGYRNNEDLSEVGLGYCWSSSLYAAVSQSSFSFIFYSNNIFNRAADRFFGYPIRPVKSPQPNTEIYYTTTDGSTLTVNKSVVFSDDQGTRCNYDSSTVDSEYGKVKFSDDIVAINYNPNSSTTSDFLYDNRVKLKSIELPDSLLYFGTSNVQSESYGPLYQCTSLESVKLSNNLQFIGYGALSSCTLLEVITLPNTITTIKGHSFRNCISLKSINFPEGLLYIGGNDNYEMQSYAFEGCTSLTQIDLPHSLLAIGGWSFDDCTNISSINYNGTIEEWGNVYKGTAWARGVATTVVHCTDGDVNI